MLNQTKSINPTTTKRSLSPIIDISSDSEGKDDPKVTSQKRSSSSSFDKFISLRRYRYTAARPKTKQSKQVKYKQTLRDLNLEQQIGIGRKRSTCKKTDKDGPPPPSTKSSKLGRGMISTELIHFDKDKHTSYKYWDNPNELVERLHLLIASKSAGHSGHTNEIISIIEELQEANIIE